MILYYVRHGDPIYDPDSLTELGHKQAAALAKRFSLYGLDKIYSSPSNRAMQTAQPTCEVLGLNMEICDWADEARAWMDTHVITKEGKGSWCFSDRDTLRLLNDAEVLKMRQDWYKHPHFKENNFGKGIKRINQAVDEWLLSLGYAHDRENNGYKKVAPSPERVALFAHAGAGMMILSSLLDIPYPMFCSRFDFGHSSVTVIAFEDNEGLIYPRVCQFSNDSHLYKEGILTGYNNAIDI